MRGLIAKILRRDAFAEMVGDNVPRRDLVIDGRGTVVNSPQSVRKMYLKLKQAYSAMRRFAGKVKVVIERGRSRSKTHKPQPEDRIAAIQNPLMLILQHCPPSKNQRGEYEPHPVYASARRAADRGRGDLVKKMAWQFVAG
jgi:hypothetical protein